jgi:7,8-dihydroneopterin aldolase/epimerase/oxygenase
VGTHHGAGAGGVSYASAVEGLRHVFVRDMVLGARIGVHAHEQGAAQRVRINVDLAVDDPGATGAGPAVGADELGRVVDYQAVAAAVRGIVAAGHVRLVETLAERIAVACLDNVSVRKVRVTVEKLDVFGDAGSAGAAVERVRR